MDEESLNKIKKGLEDSANDRVREREEFVKKRKEKDRRLYNIYGITLNEWEEQLKKQDYGCWICGKKDGRLNTDHRHISGFKKLKPEEKKKEFRGICCYYCNRMIGAVEMRRNARPLLNKLVEYFKVFKIKGDE